MNRIHNNINLLLDNEDAVDEFRNAIGFLGCRGFLTEEISISFNEANDSLFSLPKGWSWVTLSDLSEYITSGSRGWKKIYAPQGDIFIRSQDIKYDALVFEDKVFVNLPEQTEGMRTLVRPGDLLMTITGANVGKCAQVPELSQKAYVSQHVALIRLKIFAQTPFLHWWLTNSFGGRKHLAKYFYGDKPGLNLTQVGSILISLPPPEVQDRIVETLEHYAMIFDCLVDQVKEAQHPAQLLVSAAVTSITGISNEGKEKMKVPKTELVSTLNIGTSPSNKERSPSCNYPHQKQWRDTSKDVVERVWLRDRCFLSATKSGDGKGLDCATRTAYVKEVEIN